MSKMDYQLAQALLSYLAKDIGSFVDLSEIACQIGANQNQIADFIHQYRPQLPLKTHGGGVALAAGDWQLWDSQPLCQALPHTQILHAMAVDSSNSWLMRHGKPNAPFVARYRLATFQNTLNWAHFNPAQPAIFIPEWQLGGRGRRGRVWQSAFAQNTLLSIGVPCPLKVAQLAGLSLALAFEIATALRAQFACAQNLWVKWPNDLIITAPHYAKVGGILMEYQTWQQADCAGFLVIGIGINNHSAPQLAGDYPAACLPISRQRAIEICAHTTLATLARFYQRGFASWQANWQQLHFFHEKEVVIAGDCDSVRGVCKGVDAQGALLVKTAHQTARVMTGDVSLRMAT